MKYITVLIPANNDFNFLAKLYAELNSVTDQLKQYGFTYLFVNKSCNDGAGALLEVLSRNDPKVISISPPGDNDLLAVLTAEQRQTKSDAVIILDAGRPHRASLLPDLIKRWEEGYEIVATRTDQGPSHSKRRALHSLLNKFQKAISEPLCEPLSTDFILLSSVVVDVLAKFTERNQLLNGIVNLTGFKKTIISFDPSALPDDSKLSRLYHKQLQLTKTGLGHLLLFPIKLTVYLYKLVATVFVSLLSSVYLRLIRLATRDLSYFSLLPLKIGGGLGMLITAGFTFLLGYMLVREFLLSIQFFSLRAYIIAINSILIGVVLMCLGLIALYIDNINYQATNRPASAGKKKSARDTDDVELKVLKGQG